MPTLQIDNQTLTVPEGTALLAAARRLGLELPALCYRDGLEHVTSCMVCVVEDRNTGQLHPACSTPAADGMAIVTDGAMVVDARRTALELLLGDHVGDCESPCRRACPAGMNIPAMLRAIAEGRLAAAIQVVKADIALPAVLGRICPAPCEKVCRRGLHDAPLAICRLKRHAADVDLFSGRTELLAAPAASGCHVAVIGAGPAGLAAAWHLRREGHDCTLFEKEAAPGGGLRADALRPLLPLEVLDAEIQRILDLGVMLESGIEVGVDLTPAEVRQRFDAVILATGETGPATAAAWAVAYGQRGIATDARTGRTVPANGAATGGVHDGGLLSEPFPAGNETVPPYGLFAAGSVVLPVRLAVRAVGQGHAAALSVGQMLRRELVAGAPRRYDHRLIGKPTPEELGAYLAGVGTEPRQEPADVPGDAYTQEEARRESARCLRCDCRKPDACKLRRYATENGADQRRFRPEERRQVAIVRHATVVYEPGKCIACGICVRITAKSAEPLGLTFIGRGFNVRVGVPFNEPLSRGLQKVAAECVAACPTGALAADRPDRAS